MRNHERPESLAYLAGEPLVLHVSSSLSLSHTSLPRLSLGSPGRYVVITVWCRCGGLWAIQHTVRSLGLHRLRGWHQTLCKSQSRRCT